jgi:hypothetical protein
MAKNSIYGVSHGSEVSQLSRSIIGNAGYLTKEDIEVLRFLAYKGDNEKQKVKLVSNE